MRIKAYSGCLYVVVLGAERALELGLFSRPSVLLLAEIVVRPTRGTPPAISATVWGQQQHRYYKERLVISDFYVFQKLFYKALKDISPCRYLL